MKKSKFASGLISTGGKLALALACTFAVSQVAAVPYASLIRVAETQPLEGFGTDILYTLNENVDSLTLEIYNTSNNAVIRTYNFTSPDPQTARGRQTVNWDGNNQAAVQVPSSGTIYGIRITVQKDDGTTAWTKLASNGASTSTKTLESKTMFAGYSPNDLIVPQDPDADSFGFVIGAHGFAGSAIGMAFQMADLQPFSGNGGGDALRMRHPTAVATATVPWWNGAMDPIDPNVIFIAGQQNNPHIGAGRVNGPTIEDVAYLADNASGTSAINPRAIAVGEIAGSRTAYIATGNNVVRHSMSATYPHALTGTATTLTGGAAVMYGQDVELDSQGNLYFLSRGATGGTSVLWRWDSDDVLNATANSLTDANASWRINVPADTVDFASVIVDRSTGYPHSGNVYLLNNIGTNRGVWLAGNASESDRGTVLLTNGDKILDFLDTTYFTTPFGTSQLGVGVETDWLGNLYIGSRVTEETYSFSPPAKSAVENPNVQHEIVTAAPPSGRFSIAGAVNVVTVDSSTVDPNNINTFNSLAMAISSFGAGQINNNFAGTNRIEIADFGPYDQELPDIGTTVSDADDFEIVALNGPALVLQRGSTWALGANVSIDGLIIAASSTSTPTGTLVSSTAGTQTINNSWITALPASASTYTSVEDIPAGIVDGSAAYDASLVRAGDGLTVSNGTLVSNNLVASQQANGVALTGGSLTLTNSRLVSNSAAGINNSGGALNVSANSQMSNNVGNGITQSGGSLVLTGGSDIMNNGAKGIAMSGGTLSSTSTYGNPNQIVGNTTAGIEITGGGNYEIRNTMIHGNGIGIDLGAGAQYLGSAAFWLTDSIISGSTTAGIRTAGGVSVSTARVTLFDNGAGILDLDTRNDFWSIDLQDTIIAGAGDIGIDSPGAGEDNIRLQYSAWATAGPDALAVATTAPASAIFQDVPVLTVNPAFRSTTYSAARQDPDFFLAPTAPAYLGASTPIGDSYDGIGSPFGNLGGGSRWVLGEGINTITVGTEGQLYSTLADALNAVSSLGSTGGELITILVETDTVETIVGRLGLDTTGGGVLIRPANGADVTVSWELAAPLSGVFYSGRFAIGANQGVDSSVVETRNVVIDGKPAGSSPGTSLTFSGPGRHINLTGGAKDTIIRNMVINSTSSSGAAIAVNSVGMNGVDNHPDNLLIEDNLIVAAAAAAHVGIVIQNQNATVMTTPVPGLVVRNNRIEFGSSGFFSYHAFGANIYGNEFVGRSPVGAGVDARGIYFFTAAAFAIADSHVTNIHSNIFDIHYQGSSAAHGIAVITFDYGTPPPQTFNIYNNFITTQLASGVVPIKNQAVINGAVAPSQINFLHNSVYMRGGPLGPYPTLPTATTGVVHLNQTAGGARVSARNNLIRIDEPRVAAFNTTTGKIADFVEDYNTVYRTPVDVEGSPAEAIYGIISGTPYATLAAWQAASGTGANSDEAVIAIAPEENPAPGFSGVWAAAPDRITDPAVPVLGDYRFTAVPGNSAQWGGVPNLLASLPGGNTDIDGTVRNTGKPYRGAHEAATMPGDNIPEDEEPPTGELGDINEDGVINVADVTALADAVANGTTGSLALEIADIDNDGFIDADDVAALADMIVNP